MSKSTNIRRHSGKKYLRAIHDATGDDAWCEVDVYAVLEAFDVRCPALQHAAKKILCAGKRDKADIIQDLQEARDAISRAIQLAEIR